MDAERKIFKMVRGEDQVIVLPVLQDNFVYLLVRGTNAVAIDAGAFAPLAAYLRAQNLCLRAAYLTHGHGDHAAGYGQLQQCIQRDDRQIPGPVEVLELPGHTAEDRGFYFPAAGVAFTGDCLINGACGRVLGGSMEDLYHSLQRIKRLPPETLLFGGHDYLLGNLRFGLHCEPGNAAIQERLHLYRQDPGRALFVSLAEEMASNPFLRAADLQAFTALRQVKDRF